LSSWSLTAMHPRSWGQSRSSRRLIRCSMGCPGAAYGPASRQRRHRAGRRGESGVRIGIWTEAMDCMDRHSALSPWLADRHTRGAMIAGVCADAAFPTGAGLLMGFCLVAVEVVILEKVTFGMAVLLPNVPRVIPPHRSRINTHKSISYKGGVSSLVRTGLSSRGSIVRGSGPYHIQERRACHTRKAIVRDHALPPIECSLRPPGKVRRHEDIVQLFKGKPTGVRDF